MLDVIYYIFSDFWRFIGLLVLITFVYIFVNSILIHRLEMRKVKFKQNLIKSYGDRSDFFSQFPSEENIDNSAQEWVENKLQYFDDSTNLEFKTHVETFIGGVDWLKDYLINKDNVQN